MQRVIYHILADVTALASNIVLLLQIIFAYLTIKKSRREGERGEEEE